MQSRAAAGAFDSRDKTARPRFFEHLLHCVLSLAALVLVAVLLVMLTLTHTHGAQRDCAACVLNVIQFAPSLGGSQSKISLSLCVAPRAHTMLGDCLTDNRFFSLLSSLADLLTQHHYHHRETREDDMTSCDELRARHSYNTFLHHPMKMSHAHADDDDVA